MDRATRRAWHAALVETDPAQKCAQVAELQCAMAGPADADSRPVPGRPPRPLLVHPHDVPQRALGSVEGRAALVHAIAHIEFNAINLALDAGWRFEGLPDAYYEDWLSVRSEEHTSELQSLMRISYA